MDKEIIETEQYLFFMISNERYALRANKVKEIVDYIDITTIPLAHKAIMGVTNIRGDIIPIVDPCVRFDFGTIKIQKRTSFIIINVTSKETLENISIALIVDLVNEVDDLTMENILPTPEFGTRIASRYIKNMLRYDNKYIAVLDIDNVLDSMELSNYKEIL